MVCVSQLVDHVGQRFFQVVQTVVLVLRGVQLEGIGSTIVLDEGTQGRTIHVVVQTAAVGAVLRSICFIFPLGLIAVGTVAGENNQFVTAPITLSIVELCLGIIGSILIEPGSSVMPDGINGSGTVGICNNVMHLVLVQRIQDSTVIVYIIGVIGTQTQGLSGAVHTGGEEHGVGFIHHEEHIDGIHLVHSQIGFGIEKDLVNTVVVVLHLTGLANCEFFQCVV